ncbi:hypothetical protein [Bacillus mycoides]|uniref:hypothetical protein n=1 Tax=Bacillus mycoides TaxID=1405 RepID=UPI0011A84613|nr:hypothetical protein [Bacillus mycoides]
MIRDGKYGVHNVQVYMLAGKKDDLEIISNDPAELLNGFIRDEWDENIFFKKIKKEDLDTAYEIKTYAKYKGHDFGVLTARKLKVVIATNNPQVGHELNMSVPGRGEFRIEVNRTDIELIEEKNLSGYSH